MPAPPLLLLPLLLPLPLPLAFSGVRGRNSTGPCCKTGVVKSGVRGRATAAAPIVGGGDAVFSIPDRCRV